MQRLWSQAEVGYLLGLSTAEMRSWRKPGHIIVFLSGNGPIIVDGADLERIAKLTAA